MDVSNEKIKQVIEDYSGIHVDQVEIISDPFNHNAVAIRAMLDNRFVFFVHDSRNGEFSADNLEEVEFTCWPPESSESNTCNLMNMRMS